MIARTWRQCTYYPTENDFIRRIITISLLIAIFKVKWTYLAEITIVTTISILYVCGDKQKVANIVRQVRNDVDIVSSAYSYYFQSKMEQDNWLMNNNHHHDYYNANLVPRKSQKKIPRMSS
jgi:hypothetical protein